MNDLTERYVALWNEPDPDVRRRSVAELWTEDGAQILQPPQDMREAAAAMGFEPVLEARGHAALAARVTRAHDEFVAGGGFAFRPLGTTIRLNDVVRLGWEMVPAGGGDVAGAGTEFLVLAADGRIRIDYQFIEP